MVIDDEETALRNMLQQPGSAAKHDKISFEAFLLWYIQGLDVGESNAFRISKGLQGMFKGLNVSRLSSVITRGSVASLLGEIAS